MSYTCATNGLWEGDIQCTPRDCSPTIANQPPNTEYTCSGDTRVDGDACEVRCIEGYEADEGEVVPFTCGLNGQWEGTINCRKKDCGPTPEPLDKNAVANCQDSLFQDTCIAR